MSRKYRQRGYQDEDAPRKRSRAGGPGPTREGPRGRGLGAPGTTVFRCSQCGGKQSSGEVAVGAACGCGADLHTCKHCAHFDPSSTFECRRPIRRRVASKTAGNDCEQFEVKWTQELGGETEAPSDAKAAFDDLFNF